MPEILLVWAWDWCTKSARQDQNPTRFHESIMTIWHNVIWQKFGKKLRKALFNLGSTHFSHWLHSYYQTFKSDFLSSQTLLIPCETTYSFFLLGSNVYTSWLAAYTPNFTVVLYCCANSFFIIPVYHLINIYIYSFISIL